MFEHFLLIPSCHMKNVYKEQRGMQTRKILTKLELTRFSNSAWAFSKINSYFDCFGIQQSHVTLLVTKCWIWQCASLSHGTSFHTKKKKKDTADISSSNANNKYYIPDFARVFQRWIQVKRYNVSLPNLVKVVLREHCLQNTFSNFNLWP